MYTIAVIADSPIPDRPCRDLIEFIRLKGHIAKYVPISRLSVIVRDHDVRICIRGRDFKVDGIFLRSLGMLIDVEQFIRRISIIKVLEEQGIVTINPLQAFLLTRNKLDTIIQLSKHGIPVPETYCTEDLLYAYTIAKELKDFVIKPIQGSRGFGAIRLSDADVAFHVMKTLVNFKKPIYMQRYVNKPNRDIRVFVIDNEIFGCMYRVSLTGNWKTNIAQGAVGVPCEKIDQELAEIALKATKALGLVYAGIDIGEGPNGYVVFEVNGSPDWREISQVLGKNPAEKLVEVMLNRLRR